MYFFSDLSALFPHLQWRDNYRYKDSGDDDGFVGIMQTSDILGNPERRIGNADVLSNGGRLQPGCYRNESNIRECKQYSSIQIFLTIKSASFESGFSNQVFIQPRL